MNGQFPPLVVFASNSWLCIGLLVLAGCVAEPKDRPVATATMESMVAPLSALPIVADFDGRPGDLDQPRTVVFEDCSTGPITDWHWEFGDGTTSSLQNPGHQYVKEPLRTPSYPVTLTVSGPTGSAKTTRAVFGQVSENRRYVLGLYWPRWPMVISAILSLVSGAILCYLAWLTWGSGVKRVENRVIAYMLVTEALGCIAFMVPHGVPSGRTLEPVWQVLFSMHLFVYLPMCAICLSLAGLQKSRLSVPFSSPNFRRWALLLSVVGGLLLVLPGDVLSVRDSPGAQGLGLFIHWNRFMPLVGLGILFELYVVVVVAVRMRSTPAGSKEEARLRAYLIGYGLKFSFVLGSAGLKFVMWTGLIPMGSLPNGQADPDIAAFINITYCVGNLLFALMFAYGILRGQILGIDRLFKVGLNRAIMGGLLVAVFVSADQLVQNLLSDRFGFLGGLAAAGGMIVFQKQCMKLINRGTNVVMAVRVAVEGEKLELYREHYLTAISDGTLSGKDRRMLLMTARTLGMTREDCAEIEGQLVPVSV